MWRVLIRLAVALVAFVVGVGLTRAFGVVLGPGAAREEVREVYVAPKVVKMRSCPTAPRAPEAPEAPPAPPAVAAPRKQTRVVIRRPDATAQVVETQSAPAARDKF